MVKKEFDVPLTEQNYRNAAPIIEQAQHTLVDHMITIGTSLIESKNCLELAQRYHALSAVVGIHPTDAKQSWQDDFKALQALVKKHAHTTIVGIGETGIDLYWPNYNKQRQYDSFKAHIELALEHDLALVIHMRNAQEELLQQLEPFKHENLRGVLHCFSSDDPHFTSAIVQKGFALGIGGIITYPKNAGIRAQVVDIPLEQLIIETDAPFLPPQVIRGKKNHPRYCNEIAHYLATIRGQSFDEIARATTATACQTFGLSSQECLLKD